MPVAPGPVRAAQPWFERAVKATEQGDIHGRVDHASLGSSLHQVGYCLSRQGQFAAAQPWFERAVKAAEQGDIHGRVDHESLGRSLHQVGYCLSGQGQFAAAQPVVGNTGEIMQLSVTSISHRSGWRPLSPCGRDFYPDAAKST